MPEKTLEMLTDSVKDLAHAVHNMRAEMNEGFERMHQRFDHLEQRSGKLEGESNYAKVKLFDIEREINDIKFDGP